MRFKGLNLGKISVTWFMNDSKNKTPLKSDLHFYSCLKFVHFIVNVSLQSWCQMNNKKRAVNKMLCEKRDAK